MINGKSGIPFLKIFPEPTAVVPLLVLLLLFLGVSSASAGNWNRYNGYKITDFKLEGLPQGLASDFEKQLALYGQRKILGLKRPPFNKNLLAEDLARIRLHMARNGYPLAKTIPSIVADHSARQLSLIIEVQAGTPVLLGRLSLEGWPDRVAFPDTSQKGIIFSGQIFRDEDIDKTEKYLRDRLLNSGFESAKVNLRLNANGDFVDLILDVEAGSYSVVDSIIIEGCSDDLKPVALRVMDWKPGYEYSNEGLRHAALDLRSTQLFGQVELTTENIKPGSLLLKTSLENARMRTWRAGIGTWSDNPWLVRLGWSHNNLFKHGVGFNVNGIFGLYEQSLGARIYWLGWLTPRSRSSFGFIFENEKEDAYHSNEERVEFIQAFRPNLRDIWKVGISVSLVEVVTFTPDPDEAPDAQGKMLEIWSDWKWDRTDDPLSPTNGHYLKISATVSPVSLSESPYWKLQLDGVQFKKLSRRIILAGRMRAGASQPMGQVSDLVANRRFYAGGYNTMRGYERRHLGPKDLQGDPRGGQFVALAGVELRFPLVWLLAGAVFVDSGQVWREAEEVEFGTISGAVGLALDLITPLGPLRLSYASNTMNRQENEPRDLWLFGIGYPW